MTLYHGWVSPADPLVKLQNKLTGLLGGQKDFAYWIAQFPDVVVDDDEAFESLLRCKINELSPEDADGLPIHWSDDPTHWSGGSYA